MNRGDGLPITTAGGSITTAPGAGGRGQLALRGVLAAGAQSIWAPAYVSFFGFGWGHFGFGFGLRLRRWLGMGPRGWLPVGPRDPFYPFWGHGGAFHPVNVANAANLHNFNNGVIRPLAGAYRPAFGSNLDRALSDPGVRAGVTTVAGNRFGQGPVRGEAGAVSADMLRNGSMMSGRMPFAPTQASLSATGRPAASSTLRGSAMSTHFAGTRLRVQSRILRPSSRRRSGRTPGI